MAVSYSIVHNSDKSTCNFSGRVNAFFGILNTPYAEVILIPYSKSFIVSPFSFIAGVSPLRLAGKSGPPFDFVNEVVLEHSHSHSFTYFLWLLSCYNRME